MKKLLIILLLLGLLFVQACEHVRIGVGGGREDKVAPQHQQQRAGQLAELELHSYRMIVSAKAMRCDKCHREIKEGFTEFSYVTPAPRILCPDDT